ncbi:putative peptidase C19 family protein [Lyophyllum shimeji]|uniref:ubiquitinyl hydrolase 1 n=1 Tax=Lyophyllum shimeji TaxID=47721 RepID=A0A9P3UIC8_LYOSH|nr:putative peptidase C19 family protein [Lyophyllum shimeji]
MLLSDELRAWCREIVSSNLFQQTAPFFVLLLVPTLVLFTATRTELRSLYGHISMGLDSLGTLLPWNWSSAGDSYPNGSSRSPDRKKSRKGIRTRAEQIAMNGIANHASEKDSDDGYYPGLVNISGTYCFMNSTLQALASLSYLQPHIDAIHDKAEALDVPTPVIDALQDLFRRLNKPRSSYSSLRPNELIEVLARLTEGRPSSLLNSREHQDAQELFQLLSECIKNEIAAVDKEGYRDRGLGGLAQVSEKNKEIGKSVFDGLTANRRSCVVCGYTEAVMHFALDNWQLAVPRLAASCRLEECLEEYTTLEILRDCICRKCSMLSTHKRLLNEIRALEEATRPDVKPSNSKKRRLKEVKKMEKRVKAALDEGRIEDDLPDVRMDKVFSKASTKQAMIARPPQVLALHINRSVHYGQYAAKNTVRVLFPEVLDLTPYTTSGSLSVDPTAAISTPPPSVPRSTTPTPSTYAHPRTLYRLSSVVCHFGQHSFGHYICYRRKPRSPDLPPHIRWAPPRLVEPLTPTDDEDPLEGPKYVWEDEPARPGRGWLRISDDAVREVGIETVLQEGAGAFMLYYERVAVVRPGGMYGAREGSVSEETLKPEMRAVDLNGSVGSLISEVGFGVMSRGGDEKQDCGNRHAVVNVGSVPGPRIVRSVAAGRKRSSSIAPSDRELSAMSMSLDRLLPGEAAAVSSSLPNGFVHPPSSNGSADQDVSAMTASAPSLLSLKKPTSSPPVIPVPASSSSASTISPASTSTSTTTPHPSKKSIPSPNRAHTPTPTPTPYHSLPSPVVGLKA